MAAVLLEHKALTIIVSAFFYLENKKVEHYGRMVEDMYQNIVTDKPQTYSRYLVIGEYETLEEAEKNYKADVRRWTDENKGTMAYKLGYPFGFATIKGN